MSVQDLFIDSFNIMRKDLLEIVRNRMGLVLSIIMPLLLLIMFGFIYPNTAAAPQNLPVAIIDLSHSQASVAFITQLQSINNNSVKMDFKTADSVADAKSMIDKNQLEGAIIIPVDFEQSVSQGLTANVTVLYDNSNPDVGTEVLEEASGLISGVSSIKSAISVMQLGVEANQTVNPQDLLSPYTANPQGTVPGSNYFDFLAPGILIMMVMMSAMTGIPEGISQEKERGTFDGVLSAPINPVSVIIGKTVALTLQGFAQGIIVFILAVVLFGVTVQGSILLAFFLLFLGVFSFIGLGILFTSVAGSQKNSLMVVNLLMFPMMFLSGIMFPVQQMPWFMQWLSEIMPVTYAADAMRKVMILNAGVQDIIPQIAILAVFGIVTMAIAVPVFTRSMTK